MLQHTTDVQSELKHLAFLIPGRMAAIMLDFHSINILVVADVYRRCLQQISTAHSRRFRNSVRCSVAQLIVGESRDASNV
jgi:hypothetical protein